MSTFKVAGTSSLNGTTKVRFANDMLRVKVLEKNGHKNVDLVEFISPLTKEQAVAKLIEMDFAKGDKIIMDALANALDKRSEKPAKAPKAKAKATVKKGPSMDAIKAKAAVAKTKAAPKVNLSELEDAPY
jgi:hypothetical protein